MCFPSFDFSLNISNSSLNLLTKVFHEFRMHKTVLKALHSPSPGLTPLELRLSVRLILLTTPFKFHFWILSFISHSLFPLSTLPGTIIHFCLDKCHWWFPPWCPYSNFYLSLFPRSSLGTEEWLCPIQYFSTQLTPNPLARC